MQVNFFRRLNGDCPLEKYLDTLAPKLRVKTLRSIMLLEEFGTDLRLPYSAPLEDGLYELRSILGTDITRVVYFFIVGNQAVLTHGFTKKTQKTPRSEIEKAKKYRQEYFTQNK